MTKRSGLGSSLLVGGYDLSGDIGAISRMGGGPALLDVSSIADLGMARIGGRRDGALEFSAFFNKAAGQAHPVLSALPSADVHLLAMFGSTLGESAAGLVAKQANYDPALGNDGALTIAVSAQGSGYGLEHLEMLTAGKRTDTGATAGTGIDGGLQGDPVDITSSSVANPTVITATAHGLVTGDSVEIAGHTGSTPALDGDYTVTVLDDETFTVPVNVSVGGTGGTVTKTSTNFGLSAYLQVLAVTGTSVTVKLQDCEKSGGTYADITGAAFTAATALGTERIQTTATRTVRRWVKVTTTGTFNPATFAVGFARHLSATL